MVILYILLFIESIFVIKAMYGTLFVPITLVTISWCLFPAIATAGVLGIYTISTTTHVYILLSYFTFLLVSLFLKRKKQGNSINSSEMSVEHDVKYNIIFWGNVIIAVWLLTSLEGAISIITDSGFAQLRSAGVENFSPSTIVNIIYTWFAKPFVIASGAITIVDFIFGRNRVQLKVVIIILVNVLLDTFLFAARAVVVRLIFYSFFAVFFYKKRKYSQKQFVGLFLIVGVLMSAVVFITNERMSVSYSSFSFLDSIWMYYVAPFGLLDYYVQNPDFSMLDVDNLTYGTGMFGAIYNIFRAILYVAFGMNYNGSDYIITQVTQYPVQVGTDISINAACTAAYVFLRDAGVVGLIIGFGLMAYITEFIRKESDKKVSIRYGAMYVSMLYVVFRLAMSYEFLSPSILFSFIYIILCTRKSKRERSLQKSNDDNCLNIHCKVGI